MADFIGLDLGQATDFTALAVLEQARSPVPEDFGQWTYALCRLERFPLGTPYKEVIARLRTLLTAQPPGHEYPPLYGASLAVDQTGVGEAVVEMIRTAGLPAKVQPIVITGGHGVQFDKGVYYTAKKELVSTLQVLLQGRRLKFAQVPLRKTLAQEIETFRAKITIAEKEMDTEWRERQHDDLVLATALAAWLAEREPDYVDDGGPSAVGRRAW